MMRNNWSSFGRIRLMFVGAVLAGLVLGFGSAMVEDSLPEFSPFWMGIGLMVVGSVAGYGYYKRLERAGIADERSKQITYKATAISWSVLLICLSVVLLVLTMTEIDLPMVPILLGCTLGSVFLQQVANEYYRRQM
ncbi:DUF2178 domain-containing protein [Halorhabdus sp. CBA1104]|uniref:DUF2178 domain-containing protein n=1 Tax=unclassified Halorhabdus TaxID=2621901 RepID=UPI0012B26A38|nr:MULTISPECIES: DUF2178 domain-containing protein [unclassified Halorhabdus]QGN06587.1 DUF2178 domain-containing protein [Halorhabdus sp. CBA1104]